MPIWAVAFYDDNYDFRPSRRAVVRAPNEGTAFVIVKAEMRDAKRADLVPQVVQDEDAFGEGYRELPTN